MVVLPIVHTNGTSREELLDLRALAMGAIRDLLERLAEMAPNQRDYYLGDPDLWKKALEQHRRRVTSIEALAAEVNEEQEALIAGIDD
jgi:hypothetical protein